MLLAAEITRGFELSADDVIRTTHFIVQQLRDGLNCDDSTQIPSFVTNVPDGSETGTCLAVDLGGTNCRVSLVHLHGDGTYTLTHSKRPIPLEVRINSSYRPLFAFIANFMHDFLAEHINKRNKNEPALKLGFTFSFTYTNQSLSQGTMVHWDKGWDIPDALGRDPCELLQNSIDELDLNIRVTALTNDSVGTLLSRAYTSSSRSATLLGAIFGTGTNAAYVERLDNISRLDTKSLRALPKNSGVMVINTEWGAMCDAPNCPLPKSRCDQVLDSASSNPTRQLLEKQISGLYLGELIRLSILDIFDNRLFSMKLDTDSPVFKSYGLDASFLSLVIACHDDHSTSQTISTALKAEDVSSEDARAIRDISSAIVRRSARLSGAAMAAIIIQSGRLHNQDVIGTSSPSKTSSVSVIAEADLSKPPLTTNNALHTQAPLLKRVARSICSCFTGSSQRSSGPPLEKIPAMLVDESNDEQGIIDIGVDGSLYESCPGFEDHIRNALREIPEIGSRGEARIRIGLAKDGSSVGAALVAQSAG